MTRYNTRVTSVEAVQWRGQNERDVIEFFPEGTRFIWGKTMIAAQPDGIMVRLEAYQWVLRNDTGSLSIFDPLPFHEQFEEAT